MPSVIPLAMGLIETGIGAANKSAANAEAAQLRNNRPVDNISKYSTDELKLNESELQNGLGARAERAYTTQMDKNLSGSLSAILKGGGNVNSVGDLYGSAEDGLQRLTMLNENTRLNNIQRLIASQRNMAEQDDKAFMYNQDQWWKNDAQANALAKQSADKLMWSGINSIASDGMQLGENASEQNQMNAYLNQSTSTQSNRNATGYMPNTISSNSLASTPNTTIQAPNFYTYNP